MYYWMAIMLVHANVPVFHCACFSTRLFANAQA
jgi:hypothetical protein